MKFKRKLEIIEAEQWTPKKQIKGVKISKDNPSQGILNKSFILNKGDWVIIEADGFRYVLTNKELKRLYVLVVDEKE